MLIPDMKRIIEEQLLGFVATSAPDGTPNVSPKATFFVVDDHTIAFGDIRSPGTIRNLRTNPRIEVNFVDPADKLRLVNLPFSRRSVVRFVSPAGNVSWGNRFSLRSKKTSRVRLVGKLRLVIRLSWRSSETRF